MAIAKITVRTVEQLEPGSRVWDTIVQGFGVRRQTDGAYYYLRFRKNGVQQMRSIGRHGFSSREEVIGKFNGHLQDCILFVADEAYWGGDKRCVGRLQAMITEPKLTIERKGIDAFEVRNLLHML